MQRTRWRLNVWTIATCAVLATCSPLVAGESAEGRRLDLTVHSPIAVDGSPATVTGGIPFLRGALFRSDRVRLLDAAGNELPEQTEVLATTKKRFQERSRNRSTFPDLVFRFTCREHRVGISSWHGPNAPSVPR